jgi:hypothetical protein
MTCNTQKLTKILQCMSGLAVNLLLATGIHTKEKYSTTWADGWPERSKHSKYNTLNEH